RIGCPRFRWKPQRLKGGVAPDTRTLVVAPTERCCRHASLRVNPLVHQLSRRPMVAGDNNPRVFAQTITLDAWRTAFDGHRGEADLHIDVVFAEGGRVGGDGAPVRFRLSLKRAEVHVVRDREDVIDIKSDSVMRAEQPEPGKVHRLTEKKT